MFLVLFIFSFFHSHIFYTTHPPPPFLAGDPIKNINPTIVLSLSSFQRPRILFRSLKLTRDEQSRRFRHDIFFMTFSGTGCKPYTCVAQLFQCTQTCYLAPAFFNYKIIHIKYSAIF